MASWKEEEQAVEAMWEEEAHVYRFPASFAQQRMWFLNELMPGSHAYNIPAVVRLRGTLDLQALEQSLAEIVYRHESLRTTFQSVEGDVQQVIDPDRQTALQRIDLREIPVEEREVRLLELIKQEAHTPFDLVKGPLLRNTLFLLDEADHVLLLTMHHIISDGWSMSVLIEEIGLLYLAFAAGKDSPLPELPVQYADFAVWQREWLQGDVLERELAYWIKQLGGTLPVLQLPTDRKRPPLPTNRGATEFFSLSPELTASLAELSKQCGATLFMMLMAAFQTLLSRYSGQQDIVVGTPIAGRNKAEIEGLIGFFVNTLAIRSDLSADPPFLQLLEQVRDVTLDAYSHQDVPFEKVVERLQPERNVSHTPVFQVMFALQNIPPLRMELPGFSLEPMTIDWGAAKFDLTLHMNETPQGLCGDFEYNADLFDRATIVRMVEHFQTLLAAIVRHPRQRVSQLPLVPEAERQQLLTVGRGAWRGEVLAPPAGTIHQWVEAQAERTPDAVAVVYEQQRLTYRELNERANQLAHHLQKRGVGPESLVAICMERSQELVVSILGVLKAGGAYVPLDPAYPQERIAFALEDAGVAVLLTEVQSVAKLPAHQATVICVDSARGQIAEERTDNPDSGAAGHHLAYVIYTSGSTGKPKGVLIPHANVVRLFRATEAWYRFNETDVWTLFHSFAFDFSVWELWGALFYGGKLVVVPYFVSRSPEAFYELLVQAGVTVLNQTPSAFRQLIQAEETVGCHPALALRYVIFGGEALELQSLQPWLARHGDQTPQLVNMYGITETTVHVTYRKVTLADVNAGAGSVIGVPIPDLQVYVLDAHLQPVPFGVPGELYVGGAGVARGYLHRPELTAERFVADPFAGDTGARLYKTGDLARWLPNGELEYLGRLDHQVKVRGFRIELGEIESVLAQHEAVREAVVIVREDRPGDKRIVGYVTATAQDEQFLLDLRQFAGRQLPEYMVPSAVVVLETLPLTPNGKVDLRALPLQGHTRQVREYVAPRNRTEQLLATIWTDVLGVEQVGIDDRFFELGGDSILSLQVLVGARKAGLTFSLQDLFRYQSIRELAPCVQRSGEQAEALPSTAPFALLSAADRERLPEDVEDAYPLTRLQAGMIYHSQLHADSQEYHNVSSFHIRAPFDQQVMERALAILAERHAVLRTSVHVTSFSEPLQVVHRQVTIPLFVQDLRHLPHAEQERVIAAFMEREKAEHFVLSTAPLLRFYVHLRSEETVQFGFTEHHAILDGWSVATMTSEFFAIYRALLQTGTVELPPAPHDLFREFVALERAAVAAEETRDFWQRALCDYTFTRLPRELSVGDAEEAPGASSEKRSQQVPIPVQVSQGVKRLAESVNAPVKSALLAAHLRVLSWLSGQTDVLTGVVSNGRPEVADAATGLGLFLNTLPFRAQLTGGTWAELVQATFAAEQDMLPHRRYPMVQMQQDAGGQPLFETTFNFTHFHVLQQVIGQDGIEVLDHDGVAITNYGFYVDFSLDLQTSEILLNLTYDAAFFTDTQVAAIGRYFQQTLEAMATAPHARYETRSLLTAPEAERLLERWNRTAVEYPSHVTLHQLVAEQAARTPDAVAVVFEQTTLTYGELNSRANQLAHYLLKKGVQPQALVGLCLDRSLEMVIGLLAVLKAGAAYVPLDPSYPAERLAYMLNDTKVPVLLTQQHLQGTLPAHQAQTICLDRDWALVAAESEQAVDVQVQPEDLAYVIYTSGSTGKPKGVMIPHRAICNHMLWFCAAYPLGAADKVLQKTPFGFDASVWEFWAPLMTGAQLVLAKPGGHQEPKYMIQTIREQGITILQLVPTMLQLLLEHPELAACHSLRHVFCGGEALALEVQERFFKCLSAAELHNLYGPTEATIDATVWDCRADDLGKSVPIGRPIANTQVYVVDPHLQPLPAGVPGELYIGGRGLARGYLNRPDLTAERFLVYRFPQMGTHAPEQRLYKTGDIVRYRPDGSLEYVGRADQQVKIRGFRIELGEIEELLRSHSAVQEASVVARAEGAGEPRIVAYVVLRTGAMRQAEELRPYLQQHLPAYMLPSAFVELEQLPLLPNGKVDRRALPAPQTVQGAGSRAFVAPRDELERELVRMWEALLGVQPLGIRDHFFDHGGHSLLAIRLMAQIADVFKRELPLATLLEQGTVEQLAGLLRQQGSEAHASSLVPIKTGDSKKPALFCIHPVGGSVFSYYELSRLLPTDQPVFGLQAQGLSDDRLPFATMEAMAAHYVAEIRRVQPQGPYLLAGWSVGGVVAYEVAQQLQRAGQQVGWIALIDSKAPIADFKEESITETAAIRAIFAGEMAGALQFAGEALFEQIKDLELDEFLQRLLEAGKRTGGLPPGMSVQQLRRQYQVYEANTNAAHHYESQASAHALLLFRARDVETRFHAHSTMGWSELVQREVTVYEVPGDHYSVLQTPHVQTIAERLTAHLATVARAKTLQ